MRVLVAESSTRRHRERVGFGVALTAADLTRADLTGADLTGADLTGADLVGADLTSADLTGVRWPEGVPVPGGWIVDSESGRLKAQTSYQPPFPGG